jgi:uncharacterized protein YutE (UPF0331/DUF86 family)
MSVDPIRVRERLGIITDAQRRLQELGGLSADDFLADFRNTESAKYLLIVATEAAIDLCNHIAARQGGRSPDSYADCFTVLAELGIIENVLAGHLRQMARFRNFLVHLYWQVDNRRIYDVLQQNLADLSDFRAQVASSLNP